jgi:hypothetical protein
MDEPIVVSETVEGIILREEVSARLSEIGEADILVGIPSFNNSDTIGHVVRAPHGGILTIKKKLGSIIKKNDLLGIVSDPLGNDNIEIRARKKGVIICNNQLPVVNRGDAVFNIATFESTSPLIKSMEQFDDRFDYEER